MPARPRPSTIGIATTPMRNSMDDEELLDQVNSLTGQVTALRALVSLLLEEQARTRSSPEDWKRRVQLQVQSGFAQAAAELGFPPGDAAMFKVASDTVTHALFPPKPTPA